MEVTIKFEVSVPYRYVRDGVEELDYDDKIFYADVEYIMYDVIKYLSQSNYTSDQLVAVYEVLTSLTHSVDFIRILEEDESFIDFLREEYYDEVMEDWDADN